MFRVTPWELVGFAGQACFFARFLVQWIQSERAGRSYVPRVFWYLSLAGSVILFAYAVHRQDKVFIVGQATGFIVYLRNLMLIARQRPAARV
ncbi:MAG TPA: lipid-A-disaccharide synthase N-terminal domain-containing protein [Thermodesulfobacteriota bacterium]|nr:lipid-A-disaccharide synthase N-terminal domain-containing protein [Thermodesulfobacteriota bacterium]